MPPARLHSATLGRRPLLLIGFAALPIRALLFAVSADPLFLVGLQLLDGISGAVVGVLTVLVTADLTHGTGRFNLAGSRHHWDRVMTWCCAQHCTLWVRHREL